MVDTIIQAPNPRLKMRCEPVTAAYDDILSSIVQRLSETRRHHHGLGLAAPQIGIALRIVSLNPGETIGHGLMINPVIANHGMTQSFRDEGCLSIRNGVPRFAIKRWDTVTVRFQKLDGSTVEALARGFAARVIQHEIDHLDGKLIAEK